MKNIRIIILTAIVAAAGTLADDIFFPSQKGMTLTTASFNGKGKLEGYIRMSIRDVTGPANNQTIVYTIQQLDKNKQAGKNAAPEYATTVANGVVEFSMEPYAAMSGGKDIKITGTQMRVPSKLAPGDKIPDANAAMTLNMAIGKVTADISMTNQRCTGIETITVPAGTFECYKVERKSTTIADMLAKITMIDNTTVWYARGIGAVKAVSYDEKGKLRSSSELQELVR